MEQRPSRELMACTDCGRPRIVEQSENASQLHCPRCQTGSFTTLDRVGGN